MNAGGIPAEQSSGTASRLSPTLAACAATTFAAWMCSVLDTESDAVLLPEGYCSPVAACKRVRHCEGEATATHGM